MVHSTKLEQKTREDANELQDTANTLQQEMIKETKTNNTVTSKHNDAIRWLTIFIVTLSLLTIWTNHNNTGRHIPIATSGGDVYVLDTKTSELWRRSESGSWFYGTNKKPVFDLILRIEEDD